MKRLLQVRITKWYFKTLFMVVVYFVGLGIHGLLTVVTAPALLVSLVGSLVVLAQFVLGARLFRGRDEPIEPSRAWWRMTSRAPLSWVLGALFAMGAIDAPLAIIRAATGDAPAMARVQPTKAADLIINGVEIAILAFLYLNSAVRLRKLPKPARDQGFPSYVNLK
jgi:hypothetical protein